jgi:hypothetical protein
VGAGLDGHSVLQIGLRIRRFDAEQGGCRCRREIVRHQLFKKIVGEFGKFVLDLELHARGQERGAFE